MHTLPIGINGLVFISCFINNSRRDVIIRRANKMKKIIQKIQQKIGLVQGMQCKVEVLNQLKCQYLLSKGKCQPSHITGGAAQYDRSCLLKYLYQASSYRSSLGVFCLCFYGFIICCGTTCNYVAFVFFMLLLNSQNESR